MAASPVPFSTPLAPASKAHVTITDLEKQTSRVGNTDDKGFYSAENLPVGTYAVAVDQSGFTRATQTGLAVAADARVTADFTLQVGEISQEVGRQRCHSCADRLPTERDRQHPHTWHPRGKLCWRISVARLFPLWREGTTLGFRADS